ncbi:MFS transporter [Rhizobium lemnae]|uniref:MFS transporter n=1 Tax=Rhizobium lemnae TaxID=1214924 RepID=A0ABV8E260_9HYPH|nr:MFS transporter [Rhizobium lemnae]MCJ8510605.1 MFS transporter [Rhizobium lemnae]
MRLLFVFSGLQVGLFHGPVIVAFYLSHGLNLQQIFLIQALHYVGKLVASVPAGIFADRFRRKSALALGALLVACGYVGIGLGEGLVFFAAMEILAGVGRAFLNGPESAYLFDELKHMGRQADYERLEAVNFAVVNGALILYYLLSGPLASFGLSLPYFFSAAGLFMATGIALVLPEHAERLHPGKPMQSWRAGFRQSASSLSAAMREVLRSDTLLFATVLSGIFLLIRELNYFAEQPLLSALQVKLEYYGILPAVGSMLWAGASCLAPLVLRRFGRLASSLLLASSAFALAFALTILPISYVSIGLYAAFYVFYGVADPILRIISNVSVRDPRLRSTVLALQSSLSLLPFCIIAPGFGRLLDEKPLSAGFATLTIMAWFSLLAVSLWYGRSRFSALLRKPVLFSSRRERLQSAR